jgi:hypothetical protein
MALIVPEKQRFQLRLLVAETKAALAEVTLSRTLLLQHIEKIDKDGTLKKLMKSANDSLGTYQQQNTRLQALIAETKKVLGIESLDTFEMDVETGELRERADGKEALQAPSAG